MKYILLYAVAFAVCYFYEWLIDWSDDYRRRKHQRTLANIRRLEAWHRDHP